MPSTVQALAESVVAYRRHGQLVVTAPGNMPMDYLIHHLTLTGHIRSSWKLLGSKELERGFVRMIFHA